ncbi:hypothetical protein BDZ91DRAFT_820932 [Kalaharituber pfeilii]|nr:hypothetical protein BDZ91DRAFT_820932 [Kalaharituber pfeilii]
MSSIFVLLRYSLKCPKLFALEGSYTGSTECSTVTELSNTCSGSGVGSTSEQHMYSKGSARGSNSPWQGVGAASATTLTSPTNPVVPTKTGILVHGVAVRKDLGNARRWLSADNKDLKKIVGIRWLRKKDLLIGEGKKTSSIVVYLKDHQNIDKVRLGGRWLKAS